MCKCTPEIRTPFCGKGDCTYPPQIKNVEIIINEMISRVISMNKKPVHIYLEREFYLALKEKMTRQYQDQQYVVEGDSLVYIGNKEVTIDKYADIPLTVSGETRIKFE